MTADRQTRAELLIAELVQISDRRSFSRPGDSVSFGEHAAYSHYSKTKTDVPSPFPQPTTSTKYKI